MNAVNMSKWEDIFLGKVQRNINMFSKKKPLLVVHKRGARSEITRMRESIKTIDQQIAALEKLKKCQTKKLAEALESK